MPCFKSLAAYDVHTELKSLYLNFFIPMKQEIALPNLSNDMPVLMLKWLILLCNPKNGHKYFKNFDATNFKDLLNDKEGQSLIKKLTEIAIS